MINQNLKPEPETLKGLENVLQKMDKKKVVQYLYFSCGLENDWDDAGGFTGGYWFDECAELIKKRLEELFAK